MGLGRSEKACGEPWSAQYKNSSWIKLNVSCEQKQENIEAVRYIEGRQERNAWTHNLNLPILMEELDNTVQAYLLGAELFFLI